MKIRNLIKHPHIIVGYFANHFGVMFPDKLYLSMIYYGNFGHLINWKTPSTFNEKLQWLKLHYRNPLYTTLVDKYAVKQWISNNIGSEYVIPTLGVWDTFDLIDFNALPDKFVLKTTHDGGGNGIVICKDKSKFDIDRAKRILEKSLKRNIYKKTREWPYKDVPRRIIAEQYMEDDESKELRDYKFFGFNGVCKALFIATERHKDGEEVKFDYYDDKFNHLDIVQAHPMSGRAIAKPNCFEEMKRLTEQITKGMPEARVDFYEVNGKIYFGEITFFHHGGAVPFHPDIWDKKWGDWIELRTFNN